MTGRVRTSNLQDRVDVGAATLDLLTRAVARALDLEGEHDAILSLSVVDDRTIAGLNLRYRGLEGPTDVLAFPLRQGEWPQPGENEDLLLGDVVVSVETALAQARGSLDGELVWLAVHGTLHLLGYDHAGDDDLERMDARAREVIDGLGENL